MATPSFTAKPIDTTDIPILEANGANYMSWRVSVQVRLRAHQAFELLTTPPEASDGFCKERDAQVAGFLLMNIDTTLLAELVEKSTIDLGNTSKTSTLAAPFPLKVSTSP